MIVDPQWPDVGSLLNDLRDKAGSVQIDTDTQAPGVLGLQVFHENGKFFAMLGEVYDDYEIRTFHNANAGPNETTAILGDYWSKSAVTRDFNQVVRAFKEFFETGDVSRELMS